MIGSKRNKVSPAISKRVLAVVLGTGGLLATMTAIEAQDRDKRPIVTETSLVLGAYDPHGDFTDDRDVGIEHVFLPWEDVDLGTLAAVDAYALKRNRTLLITIEPWAWDDRKRVPAEELRQGIEDGKYDGNMASICSAAAKLESPVIIRWAQEMDSSTSRFTWAGWEPHQYISAYRRVVAECRKHIDTARYMWSPKGESTLVEYYPGDDVVDIVGLSVFGLQDYDRDLVGRDRTFAETLEPGYRLAERFNKPIMVAELGFEGDVCYEQAWAREAAAIDPRFPRLEAVVYFNDNEVWAWPDDYGYPGWRVTNHSTGPACETVSLDNTAIGGIPEPAEALPPHDVLALSGGEPLTPVPVAAPRVTKEQATAMPDDWAPIPPEEVVFEEAFPSGTVVIETAERRLYYVLGDGKAVRYAVGVGRDGFAWSGEDRISSKKEWPDWRPPQEMRLREAAEGRELPEFVPGGPDNPLGARALYIGDTLYRVHGTNEPWTVGEASSSGCIRMTNEDVANLYDRISVGARIVVR